jgi:hypothetical protein
MAKEEPSALLPGNASGGDIHPKGLFDAISFIEQNFANELGGCIIREEFLTTKQRIEFFEVGFRSSFVSGLLMSCLTPVAIGVIEQYIPVFGSTEPSAFDMFFAFLLAIGFSLGYAIFLGNVCTRYIGNFTRAMIRNLLGGVLTGSMLKAIIAFIFFHFLYLVVLTEKNLVWIAQQLYTFQVSQPTVTKIYNWMTGFRGVFLISAWFIVATTILFMAIPVISMFLTSRRNHKLIKAGVVRVE